MDSEEKLVLDHIKDSGNLGELYFQSVLSVWLPAKKIDKRCVLGIWTKTLTNKTGLARTTITKVLKILEGRKSIKTVKSVKVSSRLW